MQILSAEPLIEKFRKENFKQSEVGPYFMADMIFTAVAWILVFEKSTLWDIAAGLASVVITIFGVMHLKKQNLDTFGNDFISKYFCLGWIITVRMLLLAIPFAVVIIALESIIGGNDALSPARALFTVGFEILFYWWLGSLFAQSQSEQGGAH